MDFRGFFKPFIEIVRLKTFDISLEELCQQAQEVIRDLTDEALQLKEINATNVKEHIQDLRVWFSGSGMSLDTILPFVDRLLRSGYFESRLSRHELGAQLTLCYTETVRDRDSQLHDETHVLPPSNMQHLLGAITVFVDNNGIEDTKQRQLRDFVASFQIAGKAHETRLALEAAGHPRFQGTSERLNGGSADLSAQSLQDSLAMLVQELETWNRELNGTIAQQPRLLLLDNGQLAQFLIAVSNLAANTPAPKIHQELLPYVSYCFPDIVDLVRVLADNRAYRVNPPTIAQLAQSLVHALESAAPQDEQDTIAHLHLVENLLTRINTLYRGNQGARLWSSSGEELPSVVMAFDFDSYHLYRLLVSLFEAVPHPSQLLLCSESMSVDVVKAFVSRAQSFSSQPFAIVGVNRLSFPARQELQSITTKIFLHSETNHDNDDDDLDGIGDPSTRKCNLFLVFTDRVAVEMFSFLRGQEKGIEQLPPAEQLQAYTRSNQCLEARSIRGLQYVIGEPCSGKTFFIDKRIDELIAQRRVHNDNVLRMSVNEDWSVTMFIRRVRELLNARAQPASEIAVYFNLSPYAPLETVAQFFFSLLMWGFVCDSNTGAMLHTLDVLRLEAGADGAARPPAWHWFVEISVAPPNDRIYGNRSTPDAIVRSLPALILVGMRATCDNAGGEPLVVTENERLCAVYWDLYTQQRLATEAGFAELLQAGERVTKADGQQLTDAQVRDKLSYLFSLFTAIPRLNMYRAMFCHVLADRFRWLCEYSRRYQRNRDAMREMRQLGMAGAGRSVSEPIRPLDLFDRFVRECGALSQQRLYWTSASPPVYSARSPAESEELLPNVTFFDFREATLPCRATKKLLLSLEKALKRPARLRTELARGLGILRTERMIRIIEQQRYVLTPDFALKLLVLNERRRSGMSVILSGDTGTGKTEMVNFFAVLINSDSELVPDILELAKQWLETQLFSTAPALLKHPEFKQNAHKSAGDLCHNLRLFAEVQPAAGGNNDGGDEARPPTNLEVAAHKLVNFIRELKERYPLIVCSPAMTRALALGQPERIPEQEQALLVAPEDAMVAPALMAAVQEEEDHELAFSPLPPAAQELMVAPAAAAAAAVAPENDTVAVRTVEQLDQLMRELLSVRFQDLFHRLLMHQRFTAQELKRRMANIGRQASDLDAKYRQLQLSLGRTSAIESLKVVVFIDEFNTTSVMGLIKEMLVDHTLDGVRLPENLFFVAAMNPAETKESRDANAIAFIQQQRVVNQTGITSDMDQAVFAVRPPHPSMEQLVFDFADLTCSQEESFLSVMLQELQVELGFLEERQLLAHFIHRAHNFVRGCEIHRMRVSIRDIMRAVQLFRYFRHTPGGRAVAYLAFDAADAQQQQESDKQLFSNLFWSSLVLSIGMAYFLRLPAVVEQRRMRDEFIDLMSSILKSSAGELFHDFQKVFPRTLRRFYDETDVPIGISPTAAFTENLFATVICIDAKVPVMICGPPGCSKTLSFTIAVENMKGPASEKPLYRRLHHLHPFRYQCSEQSTDTEIEAVYDSAIKRQVMFEGNNPNRCTERAAVLLDEAGLPSEETMPLKVIHYMMDHPQVATVILTNKLLDAAKTNRALQVVQSEPSNDDLRALTRGCLYPHGTPLTDVQRAIVEGLCKAFTDIKSERVFAKSNGEQMFHLRDFIYFLRYLRKHSQSVDDRDFELSGDVLLRALQRNFNGIAAESFEKLVQLFFASIDEQHHAPNLQLPTHLPIVSNLAPLRESLADRLRDGENPNTAAFRYVMLLDPTDTESSVSLLFSLNLLDQSQARIVCLGNFAEDETDAARSNLVLQIKTAMELGETVVMINAQSVFSSFYDVFNRHFTTTVTTAKGEDGEQRRQFRYYANVAVGSFSRPCAVHPDFRVIVHVPQSALAVTPSPLLSRFEKYTLSVSDCLQSRLASMPGRWPSLFITDRDGRPQETNAIKIVQESCEHMIKSLHDGQQNRLLYGLVPRETVASLMLRVLDINEHADGVLPTIPPAFHVKARSVEQQEDAEDVPLDHIELDDGEGQGDMMDTGEAKPHDLEAAAGALATSMTLPPTTLRNVIRQANFRLLQLARPEAVFFARRLLLGSYVQEYLLHQEHFNLLRFLHHLIRSHFDPEHSQPYLANKWVTFIRSSGDLLRLPDGDLQRFLVQPLQGLLEVADIRTAVLSNIESSQQCEGLINEFVESECRVFLGIVDLRQCKSSQINFLRNKLDLALQRECEQRGISRSDRLIVLIVHIPPEMALRANAPYHAVFLNEWDFVYVDSLGVSTASVGGGEAQEQAGDVMIDGANMADEGAIDSTHKVFEADSRTWIAKAFGLESGVDSKSVNEAFSTVFHELLANSMEQMLASNQSHQLTPLVHTTQFYQRLGVKQQRVAEMSRIIKANPYLTEQLLERFGQTWSSSLLNAVVHECCASLQRGEVVGSILHVVRNALRFLLAPMVVQIVRILVSNYNLEPIVEIERLLAEQRTQRVVASLQSLVKQVLLTIEAPPLREVLTRTAIDRVVPNFDYGRAPSLPVFDMIAEQIFGLANTARLALHQAARGPQEVLDTLKRLVERREGLNRVIKHIESSDELMHRFQRDFLQRSLKLPNLGSPWLELCVKVLEVLAAEYGAGVLKFTVIKMFHEPWLSYFNTCLLPLQQLQPAPTEEQVGRVPMDMELKTQQQVDSFILSLTLQILWERLEAILAGELGSDELVNWCRVVRSLRSRLPPHPELSKMLRHTPEHLLKLESMSCLMMYFTHVEIDLSHESTLQLLRVAAIREALLDNRRARGLEQALKLCNKLWRAHVHLQPNATQLNRDRKRILVEEVVWYFVSDHKHPDELPPELRTDMEYLLGLAMQCGEHLRAGAEVAAAEVTFEIVADGEAPQRQPLLEPVWFLRTLHSWLQKKPINWETQIIEATTRMIARRNDATRPYSFVPNLVNRGVFASAEMKHSLLEAILFEMQLRKLELEGGLSLAGLAQQYEAVHPNDDADNEAARVGLWIRKAALGAFFLLALARELATLQAGAEMAAQLDQLIQQSQPAEGVIRDLLRDGARFAPEARLYLLQQIPSSSKMLEFVQSQACMERLHLSEHFVNVAIATPQFHLFPFMLGPECTRGNARLRRTYEMYSNLRHRIRANNGNQVVAFVQATVAQGEWERLTMRMLLVLIVYYDFFDQANACTVIQNLLAAQPSALSQQLQLDAKELAAVQFFARGPQDVSEEDAVLDPIRGLYSRQLQQDNKHDRSLAHLSANCLAVALGCPRDSNHLYNRILAPRSLDGNYGPGSAYHHMNRDCGYKLEGGTLTPANIMGGIRRYRLAINALVWMPLSLCLAVVPADGQAACRANAGFLNYVAQDGAAVNRQRTREQMNSAYVLNRAGTFFSEFSLDEELRNQQIEPMHFMTESLLGLWLLCNEQPRNAALKALYADEAQAIAYEQVVHGQVFERVSAEYRQLKNTYEQQAARTSAKVNALTELRNQAATRLASPLVSYPLFEEIKSRVFAAVLGAEGADDDDDDDQVPEAVDGAGAKFLNAFLEQRGRLRSLEHVPKLVAFYQLLNQVFAWRLTREQAFDMSVPDAIEHLRTLNEAESTIRQLKRAWDAMKLTWQALLDTQLAGCGQFVVPAIKDETKFGNMVTSLDDGSSYGLILDMVNALILKQNEILQCRNATGQWNTLELLYEDRHPSGKNMRVEWLPFDSDNKLLLTGDSEEAEFELYALSTMSVGGQYERESVSFDYRRVLRHVLNKYTCGRFLFDEVASSSTKFLFRPSEQVLEAQAEQLRGPGDAAQDVMDVTAPDRAAPVAEENGRELVAQHTGINALRFAIKRIPDDSPFSAPYTHWAQKIGELDEQAVMQCSRVFCRIINELVQHPTAQQPNTLILTLLKREGIKDAPATFTHTGQFGSVPLKHIRSGAQALLEYHDNKEYLFSTKAYKKFNSKLPEACHILDLIQLLRQNMAENLDERIADVVERVTEFFSDAERLTKLNRYRLTDSLADAFAPELQALCAGGMPTSEEVRQLLPDTIKVSMFRRFLLALHTLQSELRQYYQRLQELKEREEQKCTAKRTATRAARAAAATDGKYREWVPEIRDRPVQAEQEEVVELHEPAPLAEALKEHELNQAPAALEYVLRDAPAEEEPMQPLDELASASAEPSLDDDDDIYRGYDIDFVLPPRVEPGLPARGDIMHVTPSHVAPSNIPPINAAPVPTFMPATPVSGTGHVAPSSMPPINATPVPTFTPSTPALGHMPSASLPAGGWQSGDGPLHQAQPAIATPVPVTLVAPVGPTQQSTEKQYQFEITGNDRITEFSCIPSFTAICEQFSRRTGQQAFTLLDESGSPVTEDADVEGLLGPHIIKLVAAPTVASAPSILQLQTGTPQQQPGPGPMQTSMMQPGIQQQQPVAGGMFNSMMQPEMQQPGAGGMHTSMMQSGMQQQPGPGPMQTSMMQPGMQQQQPVAGGMFSSMMQPGMQQQQPAAGGMFSSMMQPGMQQQQPVAGGMFNSMMQPGMQQQQQPVAGGMFNSMMQPGIQQQQPGAGGMFNSMMMQPGMQQQQPVAGGMFNSMMQPGMQQQQPGAGGMHNSMMQPGVQQQQPVAGGMHTSMMQPGMQQQQPVAGGMFNSMMQPGMQQQQPVAGGMHTSMMQPGMQQQQQPVAGGMFNSMMQPGMQQQQPVAASGMYSSMMQPGMQQQQPVAGGMFNSMMQPGMQQQQPAASGMFNTMMQPGMMQQQQQPVAGGMFNSMMQPRMQQRQPVAGGMFNSMMQPGMQQQQPGAGGMFNSMMQPGMQQQQPVAGGMFSSMMQPGMQQQQPAAGGMFSSMMQPGMQQQQPVAGGMFNSMMQPGMQQQQQPVAGGMPNSMMQPGMQQQQQPVAGGMFNSMMQPGMQQQQPVAGGMFNSMMQPGMQQQQPGAGGMFNSMMQPGMQQQQQPVAGGMSNSMMQPGMQQQQPVAGGMHTSMMQPGMQQQQQPGAGGMFNSMMQPGMQQQQPVAASGMHTSMMQPGMQQQQPGAGGMFNSMMQPGMQQQQQPVAGGMSNSMMQPGMQQQQPVAGGMHTSMMQPGMQQQQPGAGGMFNSMMQPGMQQQQPAAGGMFPPTFAPPMGAVVGYPAVPGVGTQQQPFVSQMAPFAGAGAQGGIGVAGYPPNPAGAPAQQPAVMSAYPPNPPQQ